jgi:hypothetical protein
MGGLIAQQRSLVDNLWMERKVRKSIYRVVIHVKMLYIIININEDYNQKHKVNIYFDLH